MPELQWVIAYLALGATVVYAAGLFGVGIMVPILTTIFLEHDWPTEASVHMALGSSMAAIIPTSIASSKAHHQHNAVMWPIVIIMAPSVLLGAFTAAYLAKFASALTLGIFFFVFMFFSAIKLLINLQPKQTRSIPKKLGLSVQVVYWKYISVGNHRGRHVSCTISN